MSKAANFFCGFIGLLLVSGCAVQKDHVEVATAPAILYAPNPAYPEAARAEGVSGEVVLKVTVDALGETAGASVASEAPAGYGFGEAALAAVKNWVWEPGRLRGEPVNQGRQVRVHFSAYERGATTVPQILSKTEPRVPAEFARSGERAAVLVRAEVDSEGKPYLVSVVKELPGPRGLAEAALECVRQWRFTPAVPGTVTVLVPFGPKQAESAVAPIRQ